jgi:hypothetical protein
VPNHDSDNAPSQTTVIGEQVVREKWGLFIEHLETSGKSLLVSHLQMCELEKVADGFVKLKCVKQFSFESLTSSLFAALIQSASDFFGASLEIEIVLDKQSVAHVAKAERSVMEIFKELSETNDLVKYLIEHFGAEPLY